MRREAASLLRAEGDGGPIGGSLAGRAMVPVGPQSKVEVEAFQDPNQPVGLQTTRFRLPERAIQARQT